MIDVLLGKETEKVLRFGHQSQQVFGQGREMDQRSWQSLFGQLTAAGFLTAGDEVQGTLQLTEAARPVFRGERRVILRRDLPRKRAEVRRQLAGDLPKPAHELFDALRAERSRLARVQGVPPYVIFHDTTLREMATLRPRTFADLEAIAGIGSAKLERYGAAFLKVIAAVS